MLRKQEHENIVDFDDHVADVSRDWLNEKFEQQIKQLLAMPSKGL